MKKYELKHMNLVDMEYIIFKFVQMVDFFEFKYIKLNIYCIILIGYIDF
jgi:hypothetical protein